MDEGALRLDGNAAAGALREIFALEITAARATCGACGLTRDVGALPTYLQAPGVVLRCAGCDAVMIRLVHGGDRYWLDLSGVRCLEMAAP